MDETKWRIDEVVKGFEKQILSNLHKAGMDLKAAVQRNLNVDAPSPREKRKDPGGFPQKDTGRLIQSIDYKITNYSKSRWSTMFKNRNYKNAVVLVVGAHTEYARALELGHPITGAHYPFLRPTLDQERLKTIATLARGLS